MGKYLFAYKLALQNVLQRRASLAMDRLGGLALILSLYFFWSALLQDRGPDSSFLGYTRSQMLTYVLAVNLLRSFVFTGRGWDLVHEISSGRISSHLMRPISYQGYSFALDLAQKTVYLASAAVEVTLLSLLFGSPVYVPNSVWTLVTVLGLVMMSSLLFFLLEFLVCQLAFWTSESGGPIFCFELLLQFAAGAFFPLDVLPPGLKSALYATPFPYLVYLPISVYLERIPRLEAARGFGLELAWLAAVYLLVQAVWRRGVANYSAEGG